ncbi:MAG: hypothetical protein JWP79_981 [Polaromonas sp.]|nr:hypothetical protein [Polaromonas sp.]
MNFPFMSNRPARRALLAILALPAVAGLAPAQAAPYPQLDPQPTAQAASPDTPVPPALHRSAFAGIPTGIEQTRVDWKKANADVGQFKRGHADLLKWEQEQAGAASPPSSPSSPPTPAPTR